MDKLRILFGPLQRFLFLYCVASIWASISSFAFVLLPPIWSSIASFSLSFSCVFWGFFFLHRLLFSASSPCALMRRLLWFYCILSLWYYGFLCLSYLSMHSVFFLLCLLFIFSVRPLFILLLCLLFWFVFFYCVLWLCFYCELCLPSAVPSVGSSAASFVCPFTEYFLFLVDLLPRTLFCLWY